MANPRGIEVGQQLWYVPSYSRYENSTFVTVSKIGRKWATVEPARYPRFDLGTLRADGGVYSSPGTYWLLKKDYDESVLASDLWQQLKLAVEYSKPLTDVNGIKQIALMCGIELKMPSGGD